MRKFVLGFVSGVIIFAAIGYGLCEFSEYHSFRDFCEGLCPKE